MWILSSTELACEFLPFACRNKVCICQGDVWSEEEMQKNAGVEKLLNLLKYDYCVSHFYTLYMNGCEENKGLLTLW